MPADEVLGLLSGFVLQAQSIVCQEWPSWVTAGPGGWELGRGRPVSARAGPPRPESLSVPISHQPMLLRLCGCFGNRNGVSYPGLTRRAFAHSLHERPRLGKAAKRPDNLAGPSSTIQPLGALGKSPNLELGKVCPPDWKPPPRWYPTDF